MPKSEAALLLAVALCLMASLFPCTLAAAAKGGKPLVTAITKDPATSLYTAPLMGGRPLVLDLSVPVILLSACERSQLTVTVTANATDGRNPLYAVSFPATASCAPAASPPAKLPAGAVGVAGLANSTAALPAQVALTQKVAGKFLLCLPSGGDGDGVAIFGGGPLFLTSVTGSPLEENSTSNLTYTKVLGKAGSSSYYLPVKAIAIDNEARVVHVKLPGNPLATSGVVLSTRAPYTALRPDVYHPVADAFDKALKQKSNSKRVAAVAPFDLCYDSKTLPPQTLSGRLVPEIVIELENGKDWTFTGLNSMVEVNNFTACFGFVQMKMKPEKKGGYGGAPPPAMEIGGFQMENHVLQFDLKKQQLGFHRLQIYTSCSNFDFTQSR